MTPDHSKKSPLNILVMMGGVVLSLSILYGSFKWGVYYARNTPYEQVLTKDERGVTITEAKVKVMHGPDMLPYAIWHKDYLYTPDTMMMELMGGIAL